MIYGRKDQKTVVKVARGPAIWAKRALLALVLVGAAVIPGRASSQQHSTARERLRAGRVGAVDRGATGHWIAQAGRVRHGGSSEAPTPRGGGLAAIGRPPR